MGRLGLMSGFRTRAVQDTGPAETHLEGRQEFVRNYFLTASQLTFGCFLHESLPILWLRWLLLVHNRPA